MGKHILFLTSTSSPPTSDTTPAFWNHQLLTALSANESIRVSCMPFASAASPGDLNENMHALQKSDYTHVMLLTVAYYHEHLPVFGTLLLDVLPLLEGVKVCNAPTLTAWNVDKGYLGEVLRAGFNVGKTAFFDVSKGLDFGSFVSGLDWVAPGSAVVIKASIGVGGRSVRKVKLDGSKRINNGDGKAVEEVYAIVEGLGEGCGGRRPSVLVQEFIPDIARNGEFSVFLVEGEVVGAWLKKASKKEMLGEGEEEEFRINPFYGGTSTSVSLGKIPAVAVHTATRAWAWLEKKFGKGSCMIVRVDGVVKDDGTFFIIELECIEPAIMWADEEIGKRVIDRFARVILEDF